MSINLIDIEGDAREQLVAKSRQDKTRQDKALKDNTCIRNVEIKIISQK
jgi:hypothetical protein